MKIKSLLFSLFLMTLVISCSSDDDPILVDDDDGDNTDNPLDTSNYFPSDSANFWTYYNESVAENNEMSGTATETLSVESENGNEVTFSTAVEGDAAGIITGALANGTLDKSNGKLTYSGDMGLLNFEGIDLDIPFTDMILLDSEATTGDVLYTVEDGFSQEIAFGEFGNFDIDVTYTLAVTQGEHLESYMDFDEVLTSTLSLTNLSVIVHGIPVVGSLELMESTTNEPINSTNYFAKDIGLIKSETSIDIPFVVLEDIIPIPLPGLPALEPIEAAMTQEITDYSVN